MHIVGCPVVENAYCSRSCSSPESLSILASCVSVDSFCVYPQEKTPKGNDYFHGGYIIEKYGSRNGGEIDAIQIEFPKKLRFGWGSDLKRRVVRAMLRFLKLNYVLHVRKAH